jgi:pyridinium-3,5-bisthiocarboxylic acid mononucleotide nickel chelatase
MRIAYFDCFSGISGDMAIGAFLDAGLSFKTLSRELARLKVKGYALKKKKVMRGQISGTKFDCLTRDHGHSHRSIKEISRIINRSSLNKKVKDTAKNIFTNIGSVEARIHGLNPKHDIHLHELGDIDSIIDIVGVAIALDELGIDEIYSSNIDLGRTFINSRHGVLPIPAPAALELLKGMPVEIGAIKAELVTPTGAGILKTLSKGFGQMPRMKITNIGYGAGSKDAPDRPNMLRVIIGEKAEAFKEDKVSVVETNIDDMNPQFFEYLFERLFKAGALDVYTTSIQMKKSRPAFKLSVLVRPADLKAVSDIIFKETTAIGVRFYEAGRFKLERKIVKAKTQYGNLKVKISTSPEGIFTASPEYDDCVKAARNRRAPLKAVYEAAGKAVKRDQK